MRCTNYSLPLFKWLKETYNEAVADYVASIMETDAFAQWMGKAQLPTIMEMQGPSFQNEAGESWDFFETLNNWRRQNEIAAGIREANGNEVLYTDSPDGLKEATAVKNAYNAKGGPFEAGITHDDGHYRVYLDYNRNYEKQRAKALVSPAAERRPDDLPPFFFNNIDARILANGHDHLSIRPELTKEGLYQVEDKFYRVSLKYPKAMRIGEMKEASAEVARRMLEDERDGQYKMRSDFFAGRISLFVYDIVPVNIDAEKAKAMPDFAGLLALKPSKKAKGSKFLTGYDDVDKFLKALSETKNALYRQRTAVRKDLAKVQELDRRINLISEQMDRLHKLADIDTVAEVGQVIMAELHRSLDDTQSFDQINEALRLAKAWQEIDQVVEFLPMEDDEEQKALLERAKEVRGYAQTMYTAYFAKFRTQLLDLVDQKLGNDATGKPRSMNLLDDNGNIRILDVDKAGALGIGISFSANEFEQLTAMIMEEAEMKANDKTYEFEKQLERAVYDLLGKRMKDVKGTELDFMFQTDNHGNKAFVTKHDPSFQKKLAIARYKAFDMHRMSKNRSENYQIAMELGATAEELKGKMTPKEYFAMEAEYFDYVLTEEGKAEFEKYMEAQKQMLIDRDGLDEAGEPLYNPKELEKIRERYKPEAFEKARATEGKEGSFDAGRWYTKQLKADKVPLSKGYAKMTPQQRKFYEFFTDEFIKGQQELVIDHRFTDVDLDKQLLEFVIGAGGNLKDRARYLGKNFRTFIENIAGVRYYEDENVRTPSRALTGVEHIGVEFKHVTDFIPEGNSIEKAHPLKILRQFRQAGHMFEQNRQIEDTLNALRDLTMDASKVERTPDGRLKRDIVGKMFTTKHKTNVAERIEHNVKATLTGERKEKYSTLSPGKPGEWKFSLGKTVDSINNYTRFKAMALSPLSATGNFLMGTVNNFIYSASNQYFNDKELGHAYWLMKSSISKYYTHNWVKDKNAVKIAEILRRYNVLGDVTEEMYHSGDFLSWFFTLQKSGEFLSQGATTLAQMLRAQVELKDGKKVSLWEAFTVDKHNKLEFDTSRFADGSEWAEPDALHKFFGKARKINQKIHGDYHNPLLIKKDVAGRVLMLFRTWLPMAIKERFGAEYEDAVLGTQKGRYRSAGTVVAHTFSKEGWLDTLKLLGKMALPIIGRKIKFSDKVSEVDRDNIMMFVREMHFIMMLTGAFLGAKAAMGDEDDDDTQNILRYLYNQTERAQSELMFFFSPKDEMQILRDIIPMYSTLRDGNRVIVRSWNWLLHPEEDVYKRGFRKGMSKAGVAWQEFAPVTRSIQKTWSASQQIFSDARYQ